MIWKQRAKLLACGCMIVSACGCSTSGTPVQKEPKEYLSGLPEITNGEYPSSFDLRDYGYVTDVKSQGDYGYCWAFASIAAAETSILSELQTNINENDLDLSERHLSWFQKTHIPVSGEEGYDAADSQAGEGYYTGNAVSSDWTEGALTTTAILAFASGNGAALEAAAPYYNENGKIYAADQWSVAEDLRYCHVYDLEAGYVLPDLKAEGSTLNQSGIAAVKEMLIQGRAVAVSYAYDDGSEEASASGESPYLNEKTYAHYTYEEAGMNHCVTIVGWDDDYAKENFNSTAQPAGNGAWIVKNSWGAVTESAPNYGSWGVDGSGYFYLSYYDQSVCMPVAYDFDTTAEGGTYAVTQQYDLLNTYSLPELFEEKVSTANVFTAEKDMDLEAVGTTYAAENTTASISVYLLDADSGNPEDGELALTMEREHSYAGYYRETLDTPVHLNKGQRYAIVVSQHSQDSSPVYYLQYGECAYGKDSMMTMFTGSYYVGVVNKGESYICFGEKDWQDFRDYLDKTFGKDDQTSANDNFCIKAFGN